MSLALRRLSKEQRLSHYRHLVAMSLRDGKIADEEKQMLNLLAAKWGISRDESALVMADPDAVPVEHTSDPNARFHQFFDLTELMIIDGVIGARERELCLAVGQALGFDEPAMRTIITGILEGNQRMDREDTILAAIEAKLKAMGKWA